MKGRESRCILIAHACRVNQFFNIRSQARLGYHCYYTRLRAKPNNDILQMLVISDIAS